MPFDELGFQTDTEVAPLSPEHQRVWELIDALESEQRLKDLGQTWFYGDIYRKNNCGFSGCAVGTGIALGHYPKAAIFPRSDWVLSVADAYGMPCQAAVRIFNGYRGGEYPDGPQEITPGMVAGKLREWLAGQ